MHTIERLLQWMLATIVGWPLILWGCIATNLVGAVLGTWLWYGPMMLESPWWTMVFIPDCPLAAFLGSIALIGVWLGKRWTWFYALAAFACIKYGVWTINFWLRDWSVGGSPQWIEIVLFVSHIGLLVEGLLFVPQSYSLTLPKRLAVVGWFLLSVYIDYALGYHPPLTPDVTVRYIFWNALIISLILGVGLVLLPKNERVAASSPASAHL